MLGARAAVIPNSCVSQDSGTRPGLLIFPARSRYCRGRVREAPIKGVFSCHVHHTGQEGVPARFQVGQDGVVVEHCAAFALVFVNLFAVEPYPDEVNGPCNQDASIATPGHRVELTRMSKAQCLLSRGCAWYHKREFDKAIAEYTRAIQLDPGRANGYSSRGRAWENKRQFDKALADYDQAIRLNPTDASFYENRGNAWAQKNDFEKAFADLNHAIQLNPKLAPAYNDRGAAWMGKKDFDKAIADFNTAIQLDPTCAFAYNNRGAVWINRNKYDKAIDDFSQAIRLDPKYATAYSNRGLTWEKKREYDKATADFNQAKRLDPTIRRPTAVASLREKWIDTTRRWRTSIR